MASRQKPFWEGASRRLGADGGRGPRAYLLASATRPADGAGKGGLIVGLTDFCSIEGAARRATCPGCCPGSSPTSASTG